MNKYIVPRYAIHVELVLLYEPSQAYKIDYTKAEIINDMVFVSAYGFTGFPIIFCDDKNKLERLECLFNLTNVDDKSNKYNIFKDCARLLDNLK